MRPAGSAPLSGRSRIPFLLTWMDRMYRIFSGDGWFEVLDFRKSAAITAGVSSGATPSHPDYPVHPVHPCSKILFPIGYELLLFHPRMICPAGQGWCLPETKRKKELSTKTHEGTRRKTERNPSLFVFIRVHLWFVLKRDRQFLPWMIRPVVGDGGLAYVKRGPSQSIPFHPETKAWPL